MATTTYTVLAGILEQYNGELERNYKYISMPHSSLLKAYEEATTVIDYHFCVIEIKTIVKTLLAGSYVFTIEVCYHDINKKEIE